MPATSTDKRVEPATSERSVSTVRDENKVIAILCSDLHLSHKPPLARAGEKDWYGAMGKSLHELEGLSANYKAPVICAGDIFDHWNSPPELINFALSKLPYMYAIPGQHDLPLHSYKDIKKSAYWTLVEANIIFDLPPGKEKEIWVDSLMVTGFPWGHGIKPYNGRNGLVHLAVCHKYIWSDQSHYPGAKDEDNVVVIKGNLKRYDAAVFGDNHKGFISSYKPKPFSLLANIINCGTFMRRKSDEIDYKPMVGLLHADATITPHYLDTSGEVITKQDDEIEHSLTDMRKFLNELNSLGASDLDFKEAVQEYKRSHKLDLRVVKLLTEAII